MFQWRCFSRVGAPPKRNYSSTIGLKCHDLAKAAESRFLELPLHRTGALANPKLLATARLCAVQGSPSAMVALSRWILQKMPVATPEQSAECRKMLETAYWGGSGEAAFVIATEMRRQLYPYFAGDADSSHLWMLKAARLNWEPSYLHCAIYALGKDNLAEAESWLERAVADNKSPEPLAVTLLARIRGGSEGQMLLESVATSSALAERLLADGAGKSA